MNMESLICCFYAAALVILSAFLTNLATIPFWTATPIAGVLYGLTARILVDASLGRQR